MSILVVGSVAFDSIETPSGRAERCVGGAATYFALAASYFTDVRVIAVVGDDFTAEHEAIMTRRGIDTCGIEHIKGKSFFWSGSYLKNLNEAQTLNTELNVFQSFSPKIPVEYQDSEYLFLANIDPVLQEDVRKKMPRTKLVCGDTMNYWIKDHAENLARVLKSLDGLLINDTEAKLLAREGNLVVAAQKILGKRRAGYSTICDLCLDVTNGEDLVAAVMDRLQDHDAQTLLTAARLWHNKKVLRVAGVQRNIGSSSLH